MPKATDQDLAPRLRLGISSCLLGEEVRFNGGHVRNDFLINGLGAWVEWVPVCPEVEVGMGVPRENLRLIGDHASPSMIAPKSGTDHTESMNDWSRHRVGELASEDLDGFVLKKDSPSCGPFRVKVYDHNMVPQRAGRGLFATQLAEGMPLLPLEDEGRLNDAHLRENFIERIFARRRLKELQAEPSPQALVRFQTIHKLTLMAHSPAGQRDLGRLVAEAGTRPIDDLVDEYANAFMKVMGHIAKRKRHTNVLQHVLGYFKDELDSSDRAEMVEVIEEYRLGRLPLVVPITLINHHLRRNDVHQWLRDQTYLHPYPSELMLRNHV